MGVLCLLCALFRLLGTASSENTCPVVRYTGGFKESDHVKDYALIGRSYRNLTTNTNPGVQECFSVCINDCRCVSYQLSARRCELIDEDRYTAPGSFQAMPGYKYYQLKQQLMKAHSVGSCSSQCNNSCCRYSPPCLNGGTCMEVCQNVTHKFQCKCPQGFGGRVCEVPLSCAGYSTRSVPSIYPIDTSNGNRLNVYCDMTSEPRMVWTLIESFALSENVKFKGKPFTKDASSHQETLLVNWPDYRLSLNSMQHVKRDATHWRATCNYNTDGLIKTDYIRGRLSDMDILTYMAGYTCARVEYINVRGISCQNCTTHLRQDENRHIFIDSASGSALGCQWDGRSGGINVQYSSDKRNWCENFGFYKLTNPDHRCSSSSSSTTQWWLGTALTP